MSLDPSDKALIESTDLSPNACQNLSSWLADAIDPKVKEELRKRLKDSPKELEADFFSTLSFGTGGVRALMGLGSAKLNTVTLGLISQGLSNHLKKRWPDESIRILVGYDSRNNAHTFSKHISEVFAGNNIEVFLLKELRPTPFISFLLRHLGCHAAVNLTASHNPKEYSGYKVYGRDGAQIVSPEDKEIVNEVKQVASYSDVQTSNSPTLIHEVGSDYDSSYLEAVRTLQLRPVQNNSEGEKLSIIYSPLHGTGITLVPRLLADWGFSNIHLVESQISPDGNFPTVTKPNPEEAEALKLGTQLLERVKGDIFIATDPDADRLGAVIWHNNAPHLLSGNDMASILLDYILMSLKDEDKLSQKSTCIKTIVTTELFAKICEAYNVQHLSTLTGFKYIGEKIHSWEKDESPHEFIFGAEESYGSLYGTFARDKDAVLSSGLIAECALYYKLQNKTLIDALHALYSRFGIYRQKLSSIDFTPGPGVQQKITQILTSLRENPPKEINGLNIIAIDDFSKSLHHDLLTDKQSPIFLPKSNVLTFHFELGGKLTLRGSGTEPKLKVYSELTAMPGDDLAQDLSHIDQKLADLNQDFEIKYCSK